MIYVATVHWVDHKWIVPQQNALRDHLRAPFRVFANLEGVDAAFDGHFYDVTHTGGTHPEKLNSLAEAIADVADANDILIFLDGDAFPIRALDNWLEMLLESQPLSAVRRDENAGDLQPHPCFCVTTVGFWKDLGGSWLPGAWINERDEEVSDVGGVLLNILNERRVSWRAILRSNTVNVHPVFYGIYGKHIYHHGAGFRPPVARADDGTLPIGRRTDYIYLKTRARSRSIRQVRLRHVPRIARATWQGLRSRKLDTGLKEIQRQSDEIFDELCGDANFYVRFEA